MGAHEPSTILRLAIKKLSLAKGAGLYTTIAGAIIVAHIIGMAIFAEAVAPYDPTVSVGDPLMEPCPKFPMGTTVLGWDVYSRVIYGARTALAVVFASTMLSLACGVLLGLFSGYVGGKIDTALSLVMDAVYAFPGLILAIAIAAVLGPGITNMAVAIAVVYIPTYFRVVRSQVLALKEEVYVEAAKAIGAKGRTIMFRYIFPAVIPSIVVVFSLNAVDAILTAAALSFLGLGVTVPTPDWGFDLRAGQAFLLAGHWWLVTFPGMMIVLTAIGFSLLGEGLNEMLSPRLRET